MAQLQAAIPRHCLQISSLDSKEQASSHQGFFFPKFSIYGDFVMGIRLCKSSACLIIPKLWDCHPLACPFDLAVGSEPGLGPASWERGGVVALLSWWSLFFSPTLLHIYNSMPGLLFATSPKPTCSEGQLPGSLMPQSQSLQLCKF